MSQHEQPKPPAFKFDGAAVGAWVVREVRTWSPAHFLLDAFVTMGLTTLAQVGFNLSFWPTFLIAASVFGALLSGTHLWLKERERLRAVAADRTLPDKRRRMHLVLEMLEELLTSDPGTDDEDAIAVWRERCVVALVETLQDGEKTAARFEETLRFDSLDTSNHRDRNARMARAKAFLKGLKTRLQEPDIRTFYPSTSSP